MTIKDLKEKLNAQYINIADENREIKTGYVGDFLSFVMGKAPQDSAWFTVMSNVNVCAVAALADVSVVVICEDVAPDQVLVSRAEENGINIIKTQLDIFNAVKILGNEI